MSPEDKVQLRVRAHYKAAGGEFYDLSQGFRPGGARHSGTRQTPGLGDLFVIFPAPIGISVWHETKSIRPSDLAKKDWLATRFGATVVFGGSKQADTAAGILGRADLYETFLHDLGDLRRREIRFGPTVVRSVSAGMCGSRSSVDGVTAAGILDRPELAEIFLREIGDDRRRELYLRKQSDAQKEFKERLDGVLGTFYVLGGVIEAAAMVRALPSVVPRETGG